MNKLIDSALAERLHRILDGSERIVLVCHVRPDGDAIGSTLGLFHLLKSLGKDAQVVIPDQAPRSLWFLPGFQSINVFTRHEDYCRRLISQADLLICCDFNKLSRIDRLHPVVEAAQCTKVLIDHHLDPDPFCDLTVSYPDMSSTCELAFRLIAAMGLYCDVNLQCATCLLTGIVTDTRNFSVNCKNPDIYEVLMKLVEKGADKNMIVKESLETQSLSSLRLQAYAISEKLEVFPSSHVAVMCIDREELKRFGYERGDSEGLVNKPLAVPGIIASFFLREDDDCIKVSARSEKDYPVSLICEELFGGGGHLMAAGGEFNGSLEECRSRLVEALPRYDRYLPAKIEKIS